MPPMRSLFSVLDQQVLSSSIGKTSTLINMHLLRTYLATGALMAALFSTVPQAHELKLGMQTWTLRNLTFEKSVEFCAKHNIKYLQLIPNHIGLDASKDEWQKKKDLLDKHGVVDRKSTRLNSSHSQISYAVFCLKKKKNKNTK